MNRREMAERILARAHWDELQKEAQADAQEARRAEMAERILARAHWDELQKEAGRFGNAASAAKEWAARHRGKLGLGAGLAVGGAGGALGGYKLEQNRLSPREARFTAQAVRQGMLSGQRQGFVQGRQHQFASLPDDVRAKLMSDNARPLSEAPDRVREMGAQLKAKGAKYIRNPVTGTVYAL